MYELRAQALLSDLFSLWSFLLFDVDSVWLSGSTLVFAKKKLYWLRRKNEEKKTKLTKHLESSFTYIWCGWTVTDLAPLMATANKQRKVDGQIKNLRIQWMVKWESSWRQTLTHTHTMFFLKLLGPLHRDSSPQKLKKRAIK